MKKKLILLSSLIVLFVIINLIFFVFAFPLFQSQEKIESNIGKKVYVALYIGDIDGGVSNDWFFFYKKLVDFHDKNKIPVTFSFYPGSIQEDESFNKIFKEMYESEYIELMQKGYLGSETEMNMYKLPKGEQKEIVRAGQDYFKEKMKEILNTNYVKLPIAYNQLSGRITNDTRQILQELGFKIYFDMFVEGDMHPVESTESFDVIEYGVSFTDTGAAGREHSFQSPDFIFQEINNFSREDLTVLTINGIKVIPLWAHQQDFEDKKIDNKLDKEKWKIYTETVMALKEDKNVEFITPEEIYGLRH